MTLSIPPVLAGGYQNVPVSSQGDDLSPPTMPDSCQILDFGETAARIAHRLYEAESRLGPPAKATVKTCETVLAEMLEALLAVKDAPSMGALVGYLEAEKEVRQARDHLRACGGYGGCFAYGVDAALLVVWAITSLCMKIYEIHVGFTADPRVYEKPERFAPERPLPPVLPSLPDVPCPVPLRPEWRAAAVGTS